MQGNDIPDTMLQLIGFEMQGNDDSRYCAISRYPGSTGMEQYLGTAL